MNVQDRLQPFHLFQFFIPPNTGANEEYIFVLRTIRDQRDKVFQGGPFHEIHSSAIV